MAKEACKVCGVAIKVTPESRGADFYLCQVHSLVLNDSPREQFLLRNVAQQVARREVEDAIDANGCRFFKSIPPQAPMPRPVSYDDSGEPRYLSTSSPHGQTFKPGIDRCFGGSDPRLDKLREPQEDLDLDPDAA